MAAGIALKKLTYSYEESGSPVVLDDVTWSVEEGETVLLVGPSGCGKTTLLLTLNGLIPHEIESGVLSGEITVCGLHTEDVRVAELAKHVGMVFQNPDEQLTCLYVEDEVAFGPENLGVPREEVWQRLDEVLTIVGLEHMRDKVVHGLSGGQKQRLALASCLAMRPRLLLLDGPISNTDPLGSESMLEMIHLITKMQGLTTIITEYDIDRILHLVDRVVVLNDRGQLVRVGTPHEVFEDGEVGAALGLWTPQVAEAVRELRRRGVAIPSIPISEDEAEPLFRTALDTANPAWPASHHAAVGSVHPVNKAESSDQEPVIQVTNLDHVYPDGTIANRDISFAIAPGEFVALVGQNGSGKTTCAMHLVGIHKPTRGRVVVNGKDTRRVSADEITRDVAYVFQYPEHQFVTSSVHEELAFGVRRQGGLSETELQARVEATLEEIGLTDKRDRHPYMLSVGEKRRLSVAVMTITNPAILILDEPTYGQDRRFTYQLMEYVIQLNRRGTTVLFITHNMKLVAEFAERMLVFHEGELVFDGTPRALFPQTELVRRTQLAPPPIASLSLRLFGPEAYALSVEEFADTLQARLAPAATGVALLT